MIKKIKIKFHSLHAKLFRFFYLLLENEAQYYEQGELC